MLCYVRLKLIDEPSRFGSLENIYAFSNENDCAVVQEKAWKSGKRRTSSRTMRLLIITVLLTMFYWTKDTVSLALNKLWDVVKTIE